MAAPLDDFPRATPAWEVIEGQQLPQSDLAQVGEGDTRSGTTLASPDTRRPPTKKPKTSEASAITSLPFTDVGNAQRLVARFGRNLRYCPILGKWLVWYGVRWQFDDGTEIARAAKATARGLLNAAALEHDDSKRQTLAAHARKSESRRAVEAMIRLAESEPGIPIDISDLDRDRMLLGLPNGTLDLREGSFRPSRRDDLLTKLSTATYDPGAKCPQWLRFLDEIFASDQELIAYVQKVVGYCLTGDTREQCLFVLYGRGANGKSVFIAAVHALLGDYATTTSPSTLLDAGRSSGGGATPELAHLKGARVVTSSESDEGMIFREGRAKQLTGQDRISCRHLYKEPFEFEPQFKIFLATNHRPEIRGDDHGIWRRIRLIPFEITIPAERQDKQLARRLIEQELPGILNWALEGLRAWQREGLEPPAKVQQATAEYQSDMDIVEQWIDECCDIGPEFGPTPNSVLFPSYNAFCKQAGMTPAGRRALGRRLTAKGFAQKRDGKARGYAGIAVRPAPGGRCDVNDVSGSVS